MRAGTRRRGHTDIRGLDTAGRAVRQERFCWSKKTSVASGRESRCCSSERRDHCGRGRLLVFLVRLLWRVDKQTAAASWARPRKGCSSVQATPTVAWQESTWSTRSPASMNDVDTTEHWQTMGRAGTAPGWVQACSWSRRVLTNLLAQALGSAVHDSQGPAPAGQLAGNRDVGDHEVLPTLSEVPR